MTFIKTQLVRMCLACLFISCTLFSEAQEWSLSKEKDGVKVYTRKIDGWGLKEYKAVVEIKTDLESGLMAYKDPTQRKKWMSDRVAKVGNIKEYNDDFIMTYNLGKAPWPVSDRDQVSLVKFSKPSDDVILADVEACEMCIPKIDGVVRVPRSKGYWRFEDIGNGEVRITTQMVADLGGSVPDWVVNSFIVSGPFDTLTSLKSYLEK